MPTRIENGTEESAQAKKFIEKPSTKKDKKSKNVRGFYGIVDGLEKPPKNKGKDGNSNEDLRKLLTKIKSVKPFFRDKAPLHTPLVNYFYCRYMAAWIQSVGAVESSFDMTTQVRVGGKTSPADRYETFCKLIEDTYSDDDSNIERLFPFDRVKTVGEKVGMLQQQYGLLRTEERKKFRNATKNQSVPVRQDEERGKNPQPLRYGQTVAYYLSKYMEDGTRLTDGGKRGIPLSVKRSTGDTVFLESGSLLIAKGEDIRDAEQEEYKVIEKFIFGDRAEDNPVTDDDIRAFEKEDFEVMYLPTSNDSKGYSHYLLNPFDGDENQLSLYLRDSDVFATEQSGYDSMFLWISGGESFIPPNPMDNNSFAALGDYVESLMAHIATVSLEKKGNTPGNSFQEVRNGLIGSKNLPGIAVYHANVFYHLLLAQARDPISNWREIDSEIFSQGRMIGIEAYFGSPLVSLSLFLLRDKGYVEFEGINPNTNSPRIKDPARLSVSQSVLNEEALAEMANSLSRLMIAYYRCMYSMLKDLPFLYPKFSHDSGSRQGEGEYNLKKDKSEGGIEAKQTDWIDLEALWDDLLTDVKTAEIDPLIMAKIADFMYAKGKGQLIYPATMDSTSAKSKGGWDTSSIEKWLKFSYSAKPTSIDMFVECAAAVFAAIGMTAYEGAKSHQNGINRFIGTVNQENGFPFLLALLSSDLSSALEGVELRERPGFAMMPPKARRNPVRKPKEAKEGEEYYVSIKLDMPVEISLNNEVEVMELLDRIEAKLDDEEIDDPSDIGTDGKTIDMGWYVKGLKNASETLEKATEVYSELGIPGRGWLEWGKEGLSKKYTVDGYSYDDL